MTNDIGVLLNLICLKHTGSYLPINTFNGSPEWSYIVGDDGKKKAKFNLYAGNLLTNPFKVVSDSHPIEHTIKRHIIHDELLKIFKPTLRVADILMGCIGFNTRGLLERCEVEALVDIRSSYLSQSQFIFDKLGHAQSQFYIWFNEKIIHNIKPHEDPADVIRQADYILTRRSDYKDILLTIILANAHNPIIWLLVNKLDGDKDIKRLKKKWGSLNGQHTWYDSKRFNGVRGRATKLFDEITTGEYIPKTKKTTWLPYYYLLMSDATHTDNDGKYGESKLRRAHGKRKGFWSYIKDNSEVWIVPDYTDGYKTKQKNQFEENHIKSIIKL